MPNVGLKPKTLLERNEQILARLKDLKPIEGKLRAIFTRGKREHLLSGMDAQGSRFRALKPATIKERRGLGPPLAPRYESSEIIAAYRVTFQYRERSLVVSAGWPMEWVKYHKTGTRRLPRRDPSGFRDQDRREAMTAFREYVTRG